MTTSADDILGLFLERKANHGKVASRMRDIRDAYNGDIVVPLPEMEREERSFTANLTAMGIDQIGSRIGSTVPDVRFPEDFNGKGADKRSRHRRSALLGWWDENLMGLKLRRRARHLVGYGISPVMIRPDFAKGYPRWEIKDPLATYPCPTADPDDPTITDCISAVRRTYAWLKYRYPDHVSTLAKPHNLKGDTLFEVLEYVDDDELVTCVVGQSDETTGGFDSGPQTGAKVVELERLVNRAGVCTVVVPGRINLERRQGQFDGMVGMHQMQAKLFALEVIAVEKGIFPDDYLVARQNETPEIIQVADGRIGQVGLVKGGDFRQNQLQPGYQTLPTVDRLERGQRLTGGIPAEFGGECVDEATEILTADGWRRYDEVYVGDEVLTLNHETGMSEWQPVLKMNLFEAERRRMIEMEGPRHSSLTTLNHRWPVLDWNRRRAWKFSGGLTSHDQIPIAAMNANLPTEAKWSDALVEAVAWLYTEGHIRQSFGEISQSMKNLGNVERIRACLTALFGEQTTGWRHLSGCGQGGVGHDGVPRWNETPPNANRVVKFRLSAHAVDAIAQHAPDKVPTSNFLRSLTAAQLELFLTVSMLADNCGPDRFGQKDVARSEAFAFATILAGRAVSYQVRERTDRRPGWPDHTAHIVRSRKRRVVKPVESAQRGSSVVREVTHNGVVWCPTTANGTWYARRKGSVYFTGNSQSNVRTGRRGENILSSTIDFGIQEAQQVLAASLEAENRRAIAVDRGYHNIAKSFYVGFGTDREDYKPAELFTTDRHIVSYAHAGTDANGLVVAGGQRVGMGTLSKRGFMEIDPLIDDPEKEADRVVAEALEQAMLSGLQTQAAQGAIPPGDLARIMQLVREDKKDLAGAVEQAQREAQERQASMAPATAPETQPGLAQPGMGAEMAPIPEEPLGPSSENLSRLLASLRRPQSLTAPGEAPRPEARL